MKFGLRNLLILLALLGTFSIASAADTINYRVSYLGIPIIDMVQTINTGDSLVTIQYDNQLHGFFTNIMDLHNVYHVTYNRHSFEPVKWSKEISEGDLQFNISARKVPGKDIARYADGTTRPFKSGTFTVFSAVHYLESIALDKSKFPRQLDIFIDGELWTAQVNRWADASHSQLDDHPSGTVLLRAVLHKKSGRSVVAANDILTKHIASEGSLFLLWVNESGQIIRARFGTFPMAVELDLVKN